MRLYMRLGRLAGMGRDPMKSRVIRVPDELWRQARAKANERQDVLAEVIRQALRRYVRSK